MGSTEAETNQSVFTYFSEFEEQWAGQKYIEVIVLSLIMGGALIGNTMVLIAVIRNKKMRKTTNIFVCNLAVADLLFAAWTPFILTTRVTREWVFGDIVCKLVTYVQFVSGVASILTLMFISIERYIRVCVIKSKHQNDNMIVGCAIACIWTLGLGFPIPTAIGQRTQTFANEGRQLVYCGMVWPEGFQTNIYLAFMVIFFFLCPLLVIIVNYSRIFIQVRASAFRTGSCRSESTGQRQWRLNKMFVVIVVTFVIMWLPFFIVSVLKTYNTTITSTVFTATIIVALANTCQNPILYGYFNSKFQTEFRKMCGCFRISHGEYVPNPTQTNVNTTASESCSQYNSQ